VTTSHGQQYTSTTRRKEERQLGARWHALWRLWLILRFRLFQQHRHRRLRLERAGDVPVLVLPDVFNPTLFESSEALVEHLATGVVVAGMKVLDMGTGSGIGAIAAARQGAQVVAVDISPEAVRCARINVLLNRVEDSVEVRCGDLFAPVEGESFDLILFNPPYYGGTPRESWERAWRSDDVLDRFARDLPAYLKPSGRALLIVSSTTVGVHEAITHHELDSNTVWKRDMMNERLMVLEWTARSRSGVRA
jgi:release factor glutamine methyltransferase